MFARSDRRARSVPDWKKNETSIPRIGEITITYSKIFPVACGGREAIRRFRRRRKIDGPPIRRGRTRRGSWLMKSHARVASVRSP